MLADKEMPYCSGIQYGQPGNCLPCMVKGYNKSLCGDHSDLFCNASTTLGQGPAKLCSSSAGTVAKLKGWRRSSQNATQIAADLVSTGPLSIALDGTPHHAASQLMILHSYTRLPVLQERYSRSKLSSSTRGMRCNN